MNASTLRRLTADHANLHKRDLPPNYFFPPSEADSHIPDDLTQLTILLAGPDGTPYAQGLWKLCLKIPEDYPKNPPKAIFRTRIWHPNVEENTGSVCVDTLKKDWQQKLTLRDVLITISCLLIQPNPDSALNASAGHLLQDDYECFARQAKLMTSIHASLPAKLRAAATEAKERGNAAEVSETRDKGRRPKPMPKSASAPVVLTNDVPGRLKTLQSGPELPLASSAEDSEIDEYEAIATKENDPSLSPYIVPTPIQSPTRPTHLKRPLSDLPCPTEEDLEPCISPSLQNVLNNSLTSLLPTDSDALHQSPHLTEIRSISNTTSRPILGSHFGNGSVNTPGEAPDRPAKRVCSDEAKENASTLVEVKAGAAVVKPTHVPQLGQATSRKASAPGALGAGSAKAGKARVGLRRL